MKITVRWLCGAVLALLAASTLVSAHHSNAVVDKDKLYTIAGDVTRWAFVNPHVAIYWKGENPKGETINWYASAAPPSFYTKLGWNNKSFKPGDRVLVQGHPMRDGTPLMQFQSIYRCTTGEAMQTDAGNVDEYRTRVKMVKLTVDTVKRLCASGKLVEGEMDENGHVTKSAQSAQR